MRPTQPQRPGQCAPSGRKIKAAQGGNEKAGRPVASRSITGRESGWCSGHLFRLAAHCLSSRGFSPSGSARVSRKCFRRNALHSFLRLAAYGVKRNLRGPGRKRRAKVGRDRIIDCIIRGGARGSSRRAKALRARAGARAPRWNDNSGCDRCLWAHKPACIGDALLRPLARKRAKGPAHY